MAVIKDPSAPYWLRSIQLTVSHFQLCCLPSAHANTHAQTRTHMQTHTPSTFHLEEREWLVTQTCLRKHLLYWLRNKAINTGIFCVSVCVERKSGSLQRKKKKQKPLLPTATAAVPVSFHFSVESRNSSEWQRQEMRERERERERKGETERETVRKTQAECERWPCKVSCTTPCTQWTWNELFRFWSLKSLLTWTLASCGCLTMKQRQLSP